MDSTYASTSFMRALQAMTSALMLAVALSEIRLEMSMNTFTQYHWLLSAVLLPWQMGNTSTMLGKFMFVLPHVFTAWSTSIYMKGSDKSSKSK